MSVSLSASRIVTLSCLGLCLWAPSLQASETYAFHHENVLGTTLEIQIETDSRANASAAETRILNEITRLSKVFSSYDAMSEFSRWQSRPGNVKVLSPELFRVLRSCDRLKGISQGAFNPAVQEFTRLWQNAEQRKQPPTAQELDSAVERVRQAHWKLDAETGTAVRLSEIPLSLNAIAKGAIVDCACEVALQHDNVRGVVVNIGGDLRVRGQSVNQVHIADPIQDAVNVAPVSTIYVRDQSVATSGSYRRGFRIGENWYSHIIDAKTGQPAGHVLSATVVAPVLEDADALATILNVLSVEEGLSLVESQPNVSCLIISKDGKQTRSRGWNELEQPGLFRFSAATQQVKQRNQTVQSQTVQSSENSKRAAPKILDNAKPEAQGPLELVVNFELNKPEGGRYRRPFVAIWLEDADEFPVKTAILWMQTKQPGPRWHRDLLRWYRNDGIRKLADGTDLIGTISSATRNAGEYNAIFDGKDDAGKTLPHGKF